VQPVFETIVRNAVTLCGSLYASVFRFDGALLHFVASHQNLAPGASVLRRKNWRHFVDSLKTKYPMRPDSSQVAGRVLLTKSSWVETVRSEASSALVATTAIHDGPHRGLVRQANHSADETTQRYPANPRVLRGYGYHLSGPSLLVSTHPSPPTDHGVSTNACFALSIDHDLKRLRKL
jgi:hypothetical protein